LYLGAGARRAPGAGGGPATAPATTPDFGRDLADLRTAATGAGTSVVAGTGLYKELTYPQWLDDTSDAELTARFVAELTDGADGIRTGVIGEIGTSEEITKRERRLIRAAAGAHRETGAPILTHTEQGACALEQLGLYLGEGVDPSRLVIGHLDCLAEPEVHRAVAEAGAFVGFDRVGLLRFNSDEVRVELVLALLEAGHEDRLVLSGDVGRRSRLRHYGGPGYAATVIDFVPRLRERGVEEHVLRKLVDDNPKRLLAWATA
jgi:phosphotriesterase-related protein